MQRSYKSTLKKYTKDQEDAIWLGFRNVDYPEFSEWPELAPIFPKLLPGKTYTSSCKVGEHDVRISIREDAKNKQGYLYVTVESNMHEPIGFPEMVFVHPTAAYNWLTRK